ncbi:uncharacterized protein LOC134212857 [Armigeres subalbatus]|uniref:uncharacterized protein LOC134212857 n=1 Tax=Armigeres subalbatus TaxID=124917 RepID=UPI002ED69B7D
MAYPDRITRSKKQTTRVDGPLSYPFLEKVPASVPFIALEARATNLLYTRCEEVCPDDAPVRLCSSRLIIIIAIIINTIQFIFDHSVRTASKAWPKCIQEEKAFNQRITIGKCCTHVCSLRCTARGCRFCLWAPAGDVPMDQTGRQRTTQKQHPVPPAIPGLGIHPFDSVLSADLQHFSIRATKRAVRSENAEAFGCYLQWKIGSNRMLQCSVTERAGGATRAKIDNFQEFK